ncbi:LLM class flavin-dependent oxidoreductase [Catenuloplanes atrovinosus]|uniref:Luciferase family oxidoreductase group 1 n=1 Tax=Catenuloplanes atrovinosus TaxID=137266 RepID=A0AAE3YMN1_9ACTN|nr:LLM class flavin-dependent oxidoreductase [Catenuloplanes atrovinosus]MDR7276574.1 luciferase family oxidoreductase group 1 [Catenuloplanes atrovinosus]
MPIALSALELALTETGRTAADALDVAMRAVKHVDELGYRRVWFAEHHGSTLAASVVPPVLIAHAAARTSRIRVGAGGVLAPNHAPLTVAEQFATLATLHPDRIDLGIGRGPGTNDQQIIRALRRGADPTTDAQYQADVREVLSHVSGESGIRLTSGPAGVEIPRPAPWLLSSSPAGAELAAELGLPVAFAHHFRPDQTAAAAARYRERFRPSRWLDRPYVMVALESVVADTDEEAARLGMPMALTFAFIQTGRGDEVLPTPEDAAAIGLPDDVRAGVEAHTAAQARGSVDTVARRFAEVVAETGADELMLACSIYDPDARLRSYDLAMKAAALA